MSLRVMTYNILDGGENRESHILQVIQAANPDVEYFKKFLQLNF
jgi:hypothetical protein